MSAHAHDVRTRASKQKPQLRVVQRRRGRKLSKTAPERRGVSVLIGGGIVAIAIVAAILLEQVVLVQSAFHLSEIRERLEEAEAQHEILVLEAARLDSSARIERYAREELGMVDPGPEGVHYIVANIKQPKSVRDDVGGKHRQTLPTEGVATGDPYAYGSP